MATRSGSSRGGGFWGLRQGPPAGFGEEGVVSASGLLHCQPCSGAGASPRTSQAFKRAPDSNIAPDSNTAPAAPQPQGRHAAGQFHGGGGGRGLWGGARRRQSNGRQSSGRQSNGQSGRVPCRGQRDRERRRRHRQRQWASWRQWQQRLGARPAEGAHPSVCGHRVWRHPGAGGARRGAAISRQRPGAKRHVTAGAPGRGL
jgi:hypothetical protein